MKEFIYLNTDYLTSALAQINRGNILNYTSEVSDTSTEETHSGSENSNRAEAGFNALFKVAAGNTNVSSDKNSISNIESAKEILTKSFDDYSFNILYEYIAQNNYIKSNNYGPGDFIEISGSFKLVDFDFILKLLEDDFISLYVNADVSKFSETLNRENKRNQTVQSFRTDREKSYKHTRSIVKTYKKILPSDTLLQMQDVLAPVNPKFFRGEYRDISFKYDNIHLLAKITRQYIHKSYSSNELLLNAVDNFLPHLLNGVNIDIEDISYIVTPIAIYID